MTALQKPGGGGQGHRGRRRCSAPCRQDDRPATGKTRGATVPFQHALATRAGSECIAHAL